MSRTIRAAVDRLEALSRERLPRLNWRTLFTSPGFSLAECVTMDRYFRQFAQAPDPMRCLCCAELLLGTSIIESATLATFTWGLVNGEGYCRACGYPARGYHHDVGPIKFLSQVLPYHPDDLIVTRRAA